ncbi:hypothetical protein PG984_007788 [Apiospora sp. TS-2023a]
MHQSVRPLRNWQTTVSSTTRPMSIVSPPDGVIPQRTTRTSNQVYRGGCAGGVRGGFGRVVSLNQNESRALQRLVSGQPAQRQEDNPEPPRDTVEWFNWKIARVDRGATKEREQVEKHQAILDKLLDQEAELVLQRDAAVAAGATVEGQEENVKANEYEAKKSETIALREEVENLRAMLKQKETMNNAQSGGRGERWSTLTEKCGYRRKSASIKLVELYNHNQKAIISNSLETIQQLPDSSSCSSVLARETAYILSSFSFSVMSTGSSA